MISIEDFTDASPAIEDTHRDEEGEEDEEDEEDVEGGVFRQLVSLKLTTSSSNLQLYR